MKTNASSLLHIRTSLQAGAAPFPATYSDQCYMTRNTDVTLCALAGWPQDKPNDPRQINLCRANWMEVTLMACLDYYGVTDWWKNFADCTSADQCFRQAVNLNQTMEAKLE